MLLANSLRSGERSGQRLAWRASTIALLALAFCLMPARAQSEPDSSGASSAGSRAEPAPAASQKGDRLSNLRAQINRAADRPEERARLQRMLVDYLIAMNRKGEAITELRAMVREDRVDAVGFYNMGNTLARLGETDGAIEAYRKAISQRQGNYPRALNNLGVVLIRQKRWDEAIDALNAALKQENSRYAEASYNLGRIYGARAQWRPAIDAWTRALEVQPDHLDAALALARALAADGNPDRGIAVIDAFVKRQGPNKALIEARNEILRSKSGAEKKSPAPAETVPTSDLSATPGQPS
jgi:tetratricopeptide (TPR) repeat protein